MVVGPMPRKPNLLVRPMAVQVRSWNSNTVVDDTAEIKTPTDTGRNNSRSGDRPDHRSRLGRIAFIGEHVRDATEIVTMSRYDSIVGNWNIGPSEAPRPDTSINCNDERSIRDKETPPLRWIDIRMIAPDSVDYSRRDTDVRNALTSTRSHLGRSSQRENPNLSRNSIPNSSRKSSYTRSMVLANDIHPPSIEMPRRVDSAYRNTIVIDDSNPSLGKTRISTPLDTMKERHGGDYVPRTSVPDIKSSTSVRIDGNKNSTAPPV